MFNNKSDILTIVIVIVIILIVVALGFGAYSVLTKNTGSRLPTNEHEFNNVIEEDNNNNSNISNKTENQVSNNTIVDKPVVNGIESGDGIEQSGSGSTGTTKKTYKGFEMVGHINIPKTNINYPILKEMTKASIEVSVAIYYTEAGLNKPGNTVIVGHNYRNGLFFSDNSKISIGDKIYITDDTGKKVTYIVYNKYETTPEDSEPMTRDTQGATEITLSTCTDDSQGRIIIWARAE